MVNTFGIPIIPKNDEERLNALRRYDIIDYDLHASFDNIASLVAQTFDVPIALVSLVEETEVHFKGNFGMEGVQKSSRGVSLCALAVLQNEITVFENARETPCLIANPLVAGKFGLQFYAGAPLTTFDGHNIGTLCIVDKKTRIFTAHQGKMLRQFARIVMEEIELILDARQKISVYNNAILAQQQLLINRTNQLSMAQEMARMASWEWVFSEKEIRWSPEMYRFWKFEAGEIEVTLEKVAELTHPDDLPMLQGAIEAVMGGENVEIQYRRFNKYGEEIFIHTKTMVHKNESGQPISVFGIDLDISELHAVQDKLRSQNDKLTQANHELNTFSFVASHHLKEPLRKIQTFSTRILHQDVQNLPESSIHHFNRIIAASARMQKLIDSLLAFSKVSNIHEYKKVPINLNVILNQLEKAYSEALERANGSIIAQTLPTLSGYQEHLQQLWINIFDNCIKYAQKDVPLTINISAKKIKKTFHNAPEKPFWQITVKDNGIGFEDVYKEKIFEIFQQLHTKSEYEGTGIGLSICKKIMQSHLGHIEANGVPGKGATITMYFPE